MKPTQLTLEHLAGYLPYGLKGKCFWKNDDGSFEYEREGELIELIREYDPKQVNPIVVKSKSYPESKFYSKLAYDYETFKPLLRPLSDLTKEIKHNRERFVPMERIAIIEAPNITGSVDRIKNIIHFNRGLSFTSRQQGVYYKYENVAVEITHYRGAIFHKKVISGNDSWVFSYFHNYPAIIQKLYEWHFDIHGLIDAGLAVDVNQVKGL